VVEPTRHQPHKAPLGDLAERLAHKVVGQSSALQYIVPYLQMYQAGLAPVDRPAGIFLLLGPTGTGKTRTVEALAEILHGSPKHLLKIDCAEYQSDHEVAKLIGAPPGYIGHRETRPLLTDARLLEVVSPECDLAIVLFDEIEKAAPALTALLLGIFDKATLREGDNTVVNFEKTMIFLTSNLGAREMLREVNPDIGFRAADSRSQAELAERLENIGVAAVRKRFSPEFVNRIDVVITYRPLDEVSLAAILDHHIAELQRHVHSRLGDRSFEIDVTPAARARLVEKGTTPEFGARELKRTIHRMLTQPLAALVADGQTRAGGRVIVEPGSTPGTLALRCEGGQAAVPATSSGRTVLIVDDSPHVLRWLDRVLSEDGFVVVTAETAAAARDLAASRPIDCAILDLLSSESDGLWLAFELLRLSPRVQIMLMAGTELSMEEAALCDRQDFPVLRKPFLERDVIGLVRARLLHSSAVGR